MYANKLIQTRPLVSVYNIEDGSKSQKTLKLPAVFASPVRPDVVHAVHKNVAKNKRQPYAVSKYAGAQTSAESWGTGRAVARIPRVGGGGTQRAGQGAFGNMCRGGRMFAPTKIWRRWHVRTNLRLRRSAIASAVAASAVPALVQARGHRIDQVSEVPIVISAKANSIKKTSEAQKILERIHLQDDIKRVIESKAMRGGKGKMRNRRFTQRLGPLVVYLNDEGIVQAFRNIPGVDLCHVERLNLLQLAPGASIGRLIIWVEDAFEKLDSVFGSFTSDSLTKTRAVHGPAVFSRPLISNPDLKRILESEEVQAVLNPEIQKVPCPWKQRKNPLKRKDVMVNLNPYAEVC